MGNAKDMKTVYLLPLILILVACGADTELESRHPKIVYEAGDLSIFIHHHHWVFLFTWFVMA